MFKFLKKGRNGQPDVISMVETPPITVEEENRYKEDFLKENPDFVPVEEGAAEDTDINSIVEEGSSDGEAAENSSSVNNELIGDTSDAGVKKGFFARLSEGLQKTRSSINGAIDNVFKAFVKIDEELFEELEEALICADVGVNTAMYITEQLRNTVKERRITEPDEVKGVIKEIIRDILSYEDGGLNLGGNPAVVLVIGVNGVGKTTSIGKLASRLTAEGKKVILGAGDTFRAAAADQLKIWADKVGCDIIRSDEGADPAAVVFDTIAAAKARGADVIIFDTAGRLHNKKNLMDELNKISRVIDRELPDTSKEILLVLDATTGQNAVSQVKQFREAAGITGIILTKLDGTAKGGIVIAISHEEKIPVKFIGVGEGIDDMQPFNPSDFANAVLGE